MNNPTKDKKGSYRVYRGGGWGYSPLFVRASLRNYWGPARQNSYLGFRIVRNK